MRYARLWLPLLLVLVVLGGARRSSGSSSAPLPGVDIQPHEIQASPDLTWNFDLIVANDFGVGLFCDSAVCHLENQDPGVTGGPRTEAFSMISARAGIGAISAGDSARTSQVIPAHFETGTMRFEFFFHRGEGPRFSAWSPAVKLLPGPTSADHPSQFLTVGGKKVETVTLPARPEGPAAGLLVVHDVGSSARGQLSLARLLSFRGYTTMLVSLPGYGQSQGPADFAGPRSVAAISAALDALKRTPGVDSMRLAVWGIGRGATAVANLAAQRNDFTLLVAQSGLYDLRTAMAGPANDTRAAILAEAGKDSAAWRAHSPLLTASKIRTPIVLLHGGKDDDAPIAQATAFAEAVTATGDSVFMQVFPNSGHQLSRSEMVRAAVPYLDTRLRRP